MAYFRRVCSEAGLGSETFAADVAVKRPIFRSFYLGVVISEVLLQVAELYEGSAAVG